MADVKIIREATRISDGAGGFNEVHAYEVTNVTGTAQEILFNALHDPGIPLTNDPHPIRQRIAPCSPLEMRKIA